MRKLFLSILLTVMLVMQTALAGDQALCTLSEFIDRYNSCVDELEYAVYYGVDAKIGRSDIVIKPGDVNDTAVFSFPDHPNGFHMLILEKGTENVINITQMFESRGANKAPERLLEYMLVLACCSGAVDSTTDVTAAMYDMGLYDENAFAQGKSGAYFGNQVVLSYESATIGGFELIYTYAAPGDGFRRAG